METENEAIALVSFFEGCGLTASRKGCVVKVSGEENFVAHLFDKFITTVLV